MPRRHAGTALLAALVAGLAVAALLAFRAGGEEATPAGSTATATPPPPALDGAALFAAKGCAVCHVGPDHPEGFGIGPDLTELPTVAGGRVPGLDAQAYVRQSIAAPAAVVRQEPDGAVYAAMPPIPVSREELNVLVAYLLADQTR